MSLGRRIGRPRLFPLAVLGAMLFSEPNVSLAAPGPAFIVTHGFGRVHVEPDSLRIDIGVDAQAPTLERARTQVAEPMAAILTALRALHLPELTMATNVLRVNPVYGPQRDSAPPTIVAYGASNQVTVTLLRAPFQGLGEHAAAIVQAAVSAGANNIDGLEFFLADPSAAEDQALAEAVDSARHDAEVIAKASHATLGNLTAIEESASHYAAARAAAPALAEASIPVEVGRITIDKSVTAKFEAHSL